METWLVVGADDPQELEWPGHQTAARRAEIVSPARLGPRREVRVDRVHESHAAHEQPQQRRRHQQLRAHLPKVPGTQVLHGVEGDRFVFDFFRTVPANQVQHHRVGADGVELRGVENPFTQDRGVVLEGRHDGHPLEQPALPPPRTPPRPVTDQLLKQPGHLVGKRRDVDALGLEVPKHTRVRLECMASWLMKPCTSSRN